MGLSISGLYSLCSGSNANTKTGDDFMPVAEKIMQALAVIKRLDLNNVVSVTTDQIGPAKIQVNNLSDLKGLELSEEVFQDGCKHVSTVVDGVLVFGVMLSERYIANTPF